MIRLTKMQGLGNDYLYHYGPLDHPEEVSRRLSDRHFGIGSDGLILIGPGTEGDFSMRIFNADGSEAKMCGNGIRCVGKYVYDKGYTQKTRLTVETLSGLRELELEVRDGKAVAATVDMGTAQVGDMASLPIGGQEVVFTPVSVGNPHAVLFVRDAENAPVTLLGPALERHPFFPGGVNVEFVQKLDDSTLRMRVWERGSGVTLACGTGACASAAAAVASGLFPEGREVTVRLDGGDLKIHVLPGGAVRMTGPAATICECEVELG